MVASIRRTPRSVSQHTGRTCLHSVNAMYNCAHHALVQGENFIQSQRTLKGVIQAMTVIDLQAVTAPSSLSPAIFLLCNNLPPATFLSAIHFLLRRLCSHTQSRNPELVHPHLPEYKPAAVRLGDLSCSSSSAPCIVNRCRNTASLKCAGSLQ